MAQEKIQTNTNFRQWLPIGLSILALVISLAAWDKVNNTSIQDQLKDIQVSIAGFNQKAATSNAVSQLEQVRNDFAKNRNYEEAQKKINEIRQDLKTSFSGVQKDVQMTWQKIDNELAKIDLELREKAVGVLDTIDGLIAKLK